MLLEEFILENDVTDETLKEKLCRAMAEEEKQNEVDISAYKVLAKFSDNAYDRNIIIDNYELDLKYRERCLIY